MGKKKVTAYTASCFVIALPLVLHNVIRMSVSGLLFSLLTLAIFFLLFHFVILRPVGMFVKYEIEDDKIKITNLLKKTSIVFPLKGENLHVYKYSLFSLVQSYEPLVSKRDAKQKIREGKAGVILLLYELRSSTTFIELIAQKLK